MEQGLFNPLTLGGSILVNDVAASVHSEWFLDDLFDSLKLTALLPAAYQVSNPTHGLLCIWPCSSSPRHAEKYCTSYLPIL